MHFVALLKPAILETDVHLFQLPQSLSEMCSLRDKNHSPIEAPRIILALMGFQHWPIAGTKPETRGNQLCGPSSKGISEATR